MAATHRAVVVAEAGAPGELRDVPTPQPRAAEVLVRIAAAAVNPVDWKVLDEPRRYPYIQSYPTVLGSDAAGVVEAAGAQSGFEAGERVFFQGIIGELQASTFQEKTLMPAELVSRTPPNISDEAAAGVSLAAMAVLAGFYHEGAGRAVAPPPWEKGGAAAGQGRAVVVLGGSSSVGQYAVQLARLSGFERIVTASSPAHHDLLRTLGATAVLDRHSATAAQYVEATHGLPLDFVYDSISEAQTQQLAVDILAGARAGDGATPRAVVTVLPQDAAAVASGKKHNIDINAVFGKGSAPHLRPLAVPFSQALSAWLKDGSLVPNRPEVVPGGLAALDAALEKNRAGISGRKVVLKLSGDAGAQDTADVGRIGAQIAHLKGKYAQNALNYERNTGKPLDVRRSDAE